LAKNEAIEHLKMDFETVDGLGPEAFRYQLIRDYLALLAQTQTYYLRRYQAVDGIKRRLSLWAIRVAMTRGESEKTLQLNRSYADS
jgi:hypothetical protein